jgi:lipoprotein NlpD
LFRCVEEWREGGRMKSLARYLTVVALVAVLGACSSQKPAPVVDRSGTGSAGRPGAAPDKAVAGATAARVAKDGVYTVQKGDTLYSIATAFRVDVHELARWNGLQDASALNIGQSLRVTPPADAAVATVTPVTPGGSTEVRPLPVPGGGSATEPTPLPPPASTEPSSAAPAQAPGAVPAPAPAPAPVPTPTPSTTPATASPSALAWLWPASGAVIDGFDAPRNKGIDIGGIEGAPVQAAADGEVVHVGNALRGYGNLVIIRHAGDYVTAYGHNRKILVQQGQHVKRGQQIAELGKTDADRPKLHFEIRHQGKPLDPVKYLPAR